VASDVEQTQNVVSAVRHKVAPSLAVEAATAKLRNRALHLFDVNHKWPRQITHHRLQLFVSQCINHGLMTYFESIQCLSCTRASACRCHEDTNTTDSWPPLISQIHPQTLDVQKSHHIRFGQEDRIHCRPRECVDPARLQHFFRSDATRICQLDACQCELHMVRHVCLVGLRLLHNIKNERSP
jgi:hypothetical protein